MISASKKIMTTTAVSMRLPSSVKQPLSCLMNNHRSSLAASTSTISTITKRTLVHVEQHRSGKDKDNSINININNNNNTATKKKSQPSTQQRNNRSRRTRKSRLSLDEKEVPSYKEFVHRFTVLSLYRGYLKCIRDSMPHNQDDLRDQVRKEFQVNKNDNDPFAVKRNIAEGQRRFEELKEFTGQSNKYTGEESWINIQDPDDARGRVGTGWPWAK